MSEANEQVYVAAATGNLKKLQEALAAGGDANAPSADGLTPMVVAARLGFVDGIRALVAKGGDPAAPAGFFGTPLRHAAAEGHLETVRALVEAGAPFLSRSDAEGPAIVWAVDSGDPEIVRALLAGGAAPDDQNSAGQTPLIASVVKGKPLVAAALVAAGANRSVRDGMGRTALDWANEKEDAQLVALLTDAIGPDEIEGREPEGVPQYRYVPVSGPWLSVEGVVFEEGETDVHPYVRALLAGKHALGLRDHYPYDRVDHIWRRCDEVKDRLSAALAACLEDKNPVVRAQALMFFQAHPEAKGAERIEDLAAGDRGLFAGVDDPIHSGVDLEHQLLTALARRATKENWRARTIAEKLILEPGRGEPLMNAVDREFLMRNAEKIAQATPATGAQLIGMMMNEGNWLPVLPLAASHPDFEQRLGWSVHDETQRAQILAFARFLQKQRADAEGEADGSAHYQRGLDAFNGQGRAKDVDEAFRLHTEAARRGNADAAFELSIFYAKGLGCAADLEEAARHLRAAAEKGHPRALFNLGAFHASGSNPAFVKDMARAAEWYKKAAAAGSGQAAATLAVMCMAGDGVPPSPLGARHWIMRADTLGFDVAGFMTRLGLDPSGIEEGVETFESARRAIADGDLPALTDLIDDGLDPHMADEAGVTLLELAERQGRTEQVDALRAAV